jgi:hypothetical protein
MHESAAWTVSGAVAGGAGGAMGNAESFSARFFRSLCFIAASVWKGEADTNV